MTDPRIKKTTANLDSERFQSGAEKYAAYLETPEGRLRLDLALANLQEFLPQPTGDLHALDIGCGTGATGVRLTQLGIHVTLMDSSPSMLDFAKRAAEEVGVSDRIALKQGEAAQLASIFQPGSFDIILCHNVLEYVEDPNAVLFAAARIMRNSSAILSVVVRNQAGEILKAAIQAGDLVAAENGLRAEWGVESLYGGRVRLFTPDALQAMLKAASLAVIAERGVRVVSDYLPSQVSRTTEYERIFDLERSLGRRPEFAAVARYTQYLVRRADPTIRNDA